MTATARTEGDLGTRGRVSAFFAGKRRLRLAALLAPPMFLLVVGDFWGLVFWLVVVYFGALAYLLVSAFWGLNSFTGNVVHTYSTANLHAVFTQPLYRTVATRTLGIALGGTVIDALIAFPMAFYMSVIAGPRTRRFLVVAVLTPLWASYLVKAYAWRSLLSPTGALSYLSGTPGYGETAVVIT